jgi:hypothetical protein
MSVTMADQMPLVTPSQCSGTDEDARLRLDEAITSLRRNGVGLKGPLKSSRCLPTSLS